MSSSSSRAVSMMIGTLLRLRRRRQTSSPSTFGSIRSSTTRSTCSPANRRRASSPSRAWSDAEPLVLERIREELLDCLLVVDEEDGGGLGHRAAPISLPAASPRPTIDRPWRPSRLHPSGAGRGPARSSARSTVGSTAAPGCSSACRCFCSRSASRSRPRSSRPTCRRPSTRRRPPSSPPTSRFATPTAAPGRRERRRRRPGSPASCNRTGSRSAGKRSRPTSPAAGRCASSTSRRRSAASRPGRSS